MKPESIITLVLVLAVVFYLTWLTTRFVAGKSRMGMGRFMKVVDRMAIGQDKSILVVKIGGSYCVVGVSSHDMRLIKTLSEEEAEAFETQGNAASTGTATEEMFRNMQSFGGRLATALHRPSRRQAADAAFYKTAAEDTQEDSTVIDMLDQRVRQRKETKRW
jgi:flagellar protein FliO/FliZ